ncbi:MAG: FHA domain-containing protein [Planctomycetes bacterium]|jgi:predicted component of type VI protein secretion system|nr:FHA domain-containing protein [Planctomycetota bacterium]
MAKLIVRTGEKAGMEYEVKEGTVLGREAGVTVPILDPKASRRHAQFGVEGSQFALEDLGSTNGTFVNGSRITRQRLHHGDVVRIGATEFLYNDPANRRPEAPSPPAAPPAPPVAPAPAKKPIQITPAHRRPRPGPRRH